MSQLPSLSPLYFLLHVSPYACYHGDVSRKQGRSDETEWTGPMTEDELLKQTTIITA